MDRKQISNLTTTGYSFWDQLRNFLHELFCQFISWTNWVNSGKFMDNCWISCQVMAGMEKFYDDLIIFNLYRRYILRSTHLFIPLFVFQLVSKIVLPKFEKKIVVCEWLAWWSNLVLWNGPRRCFSFDLIRNLLCP